MCFLFWNFSFYSVPSWNVNFWIVFFSKSSNTASKLILTANIWWNWQKKKLAFSIEMFSDVLVFVFLGTETKGKKLHFYFLVLCILPEVLLSTRRLYAHLKPIFTCSNINLHICCRHMRAFWKTLSLSLSQLWICGKMFLCMFTSDDAENKY